MNILTKDDLVKQPLVIDLLKAEHELVEYFIRFIVSSSFDQELKNLILKVEDAANAIRISSFKNSKE